MSCIACSIATQRSVIAPLAGIVGHRRLGGRMVLGALLLAGCVPWAWAQDISPAPLTVGGDPYPSGGQALRVNGSTLSVSSSYAYWNGSAFTGTPSPLDLTADTAWMKVANSHTSGHDSGFMAYGATSTGVLKPAFAMGWVGTSNWDNSMVSHQICDAYMLVRNNSDQLVERMRWKSNGSVLVGGPMILGTDPGGSELMRVGGGITMASANGSSSSLGSSFGNLIKHQRFGYSSSYTATQVGSANRPVAINIDPNTVAGGSFLGSAQEVLLNRNSIWRQPNSAGTNWELAGVALGEASFQGAVPGTPSSSQVLIGGGHIKAGGEISSAAAFYPGSRSVYLAGSDIGAQYQSDGSAWTGTPFAAQSGWMIFQSRSSAYTGNRGFGFVGGSNPAVKALIYDDGGLALGSTSAGSAISPGAGTLKMDGSAIIGGQVHVGGKITQGVAVDAKLHVKGKIAAQEVVVTLADWSDDVFADDYRLPSLDEVAQHIAEKRHLPGIPAEAELVRDGVGMGDMLNRHMAKIEELTLYAIDLQKQNRSLRAELDDVRAAQAGAQGDNAALRAELADLRATQAAQAAQLAQLVKRLAQEKP